MGVSRSREPDSEQARRVAEEGCILRAVVGSTVHGLSNPGTDDRDEMGVCVEPPEYVVGMRQFDHWVYRTQDEGVPSGPGDLDLTIYALREYCRLAVKGSPTVLLLFFIDGEHVIERTPLGVELQRLAPAFISKRVGRAFLGYLDRQHRGLLGELHGTRTRELSPEHGYDTKYAMHALRIAHQGHELLTTGRIALPVAEPMRSRLMDVRSGKPALGELIDELQAQAASLENAAVAANLPDEPDLPAIDRFLIHAYEQTWSQRR
jgi:predicted nucleotidyltransferase